MQNNFYSVFAPTLATLAYMLNQCNLVNNYFQVGNVTTNN